MPKQLLLPGFPEGAQKIGDALSVLEKEGTVTYFVYGDNYFSHKKEDKQSQRFALASLMENGHVRACDLEGQPYVIPHRTLMNWTAQYRKQGPSSFFRPTGGRKSRVMTPDKTAECNRLIAEGIYPELRASSSAISEVKLSYDYFLCSFFSYCQTKLHSSIKDSCYLYPGVKTSFKIIVTSQPYPSYDGQSRISSGLSQRASSRWTTSDSSTALLY